MHSSNKRIIFLLVGTLISAVAVIVLLYLARPGSEGDLGVAANICGELIPPEVLGARTVDDRTMAIRDIRSDLEQLEITEEVDSGMKTLCPELRATYVILFEVDSLAGL